LAAPDEIDRRFNPKLPPDARITTVFEQNDGRLLVAGSVLPPEHSKVQSLTFFIRLRANGQPDPTFRPQRNGLEILDVGEITERADGIGVIGTFRVGNEGAIRSAVVFQHNGKLAPYTPATNFGKGTWLPDGGIAFDGFDHNQTYGRIGFLDANGAGPIYVDIPYEQSQFVWLKGMPDGDVVGYLFRPPSVPPGQPRRLMYSMQNGGAGFDFYPDPIAALGPSNTLYLATDGLVLWRGARPFIYQLPDAIFDHLPRDIPCLAPQSDGSVVYSMRYTVHGTNFIFRCASDCSNDQTFPTLLPNAPVNGLLALHNGKTLAWGDFTEINGTPIPGFVRLNSE
jgi:hypothetical protein